MNILFAGNSKIFDGLLISSISLLKHTKTPIHAICLTMDLSEINPKFTPINKTQESYLDKLFKKTNPNSSFKVVDITEMFKKEMINSVNLKNHFTPYAMLRLFIDKVDNVPDKIIYLDADTIINNDLNELFNINIENFEIACVKDAYRINKKYFNAGVLLMNMKMIKETKLLEKARYLCLTRKMLYMDQDALNRCTTKKLMLPLKFNAKDKYFPEIVVHHFCNVRKHFFHRIKPWEIDLVREKLPVYNEILDEYIKLKNDFIKNNQKI